MDRMPSVVLPAFIGDNMSGECHYHMTYRSIPRERRQAIRVRRRQSNRAFSVVTSMVVRSSELLAQEPSVAETLSDHSGTLGSHCCVRLSACMLFEVG